MMVLAAVAHLAGAVAPLFTFSSGEMLATGLAALLSLALAVLFGWFARRLLSDGVRREFRAPGQAVL
jgi:hypothetical protein